ncbi:MAG: alpha-hydroxy-acid oxidizing protein [Acidobacteria bacterium]|nr:alpha-hydroxy-acid oxidizing protein [Acidobacteriota bacterium]
MKPPTGETVRDYYEGGSGDETTLVENVRAWRAVRFRPRVLRDVGEVSTSTQLLGSRLSGPVLVAPTALHGLAHPDGEVATRRGTAQAGSLMILSTRSTVPLEQVAAAATGPWWFQIYAMRDRGLTLDLAARAAQAGARALVLTGDTPVVGVKRRRTPGLDVADLHLEHLRSQTGRDLSPSDVEQDPSVDLRFIGDLQKAVGLPVLVKGVLRGDDALACIDAGAAGVIVSNHGGRQLDRAIPTAWALPEVAAAVHGQVPVLVDGGLRAGLDVLAALALGAGGVLLGRPVLAALADGGAAGVERCLMDLHHELAHVMALAGASSPAEVGADLVRTIAR